MRISNLLTACTLRISAIAAQAAPPTLDGAFVRSWRGTAEIVVNWTKQRTLPVILAIASDGSVAGKVGDAVIVGGKFRRNRGFIGRALRLKTDYIITGRLEGLVIASEGIDRDSFTMPLNWREDVSSAAFTPATARSAVAST